MCVWSECVYVCVSHWWYLTIHLYLLFRKPNLPRAGNNKCVYIIIVYLGTQLRYQHFIMTSNGEGSREFPTKIIKYHFSV